MKSKSGFTIIEVTLAVAIIGILATISIFAYLKVQQQAHDTQRQATATNVAEGLERYYEAHGEYPGVANVTNSDPTVAQNILRMTTLDNLTQPSSSSTNIWQAGAANASKLLTYSGNTDASSACTTATGTSGACADYKIQYYDEETGTIKTIYSRNKSSTVATTVASDQQIAPPVTPTISIAVSGGTVTATAGAITCQPGAISQYAFQSRTNNGAWTIGPWSQTTTASATTTEGTKFGFEVKSRCVLNGVPSPESNFSNEVAYIAPITTPGVPTLTNTSDAANTNWSWGTASCAPTTTAYYTINSGNDFDTTGAQNWWMGWQADQTSTSWLRGTTSQGYNYASKIKARCASNFATSNWSAESNVSTYLRPVVAPGGPTNWSFAELNGRALYDWYWTEPTCGPGTASAFQWDAYIGDVNNSGGLRMYWTAKGPYYHYWYGTSAPTLQDTTWYTGGNLELTFNGTSTPTGIDVYSAITYRCQNPNTLRTAVGARYQSPLNYT